MRADEPALASVQLLTRGHELTMKDMKDVKKFFITFNLFMVACLAGITASRHVSPLLRKFSAPAFVRGRTVD